MTYTIDQIRQAGKEGEVNHLDVEHIIDLLKEQPNVEGNEKKSWPPAFTYMENITIGNETKEGFLLSREDLGKFISEVYTETEWYPDYVAKGEAKESKQTRIDFIRGWVAREFCDKQISMLNSDMQTNGASQEQLNSKVEDGNQKEPLYRWGKAAPDNLPKEDACIRFKDGDGIYNYAKSKSFHNILNISDCEWLCKEVETPEQDELKKDFVEGLGENEYYDLSDLSDEQKKEFVQGFMTTVGKDFLKVFLGLALKTHMEAMIIDDVSKREFILSFKKLTEPCSHERTYSNVDGFAYCDKCGIPMQ